MVVKIVQGDALAILKTLKSDCINTCITSPPYWGLRDYGTATWVGGDPTCSHKPPDEAGATNKPSAGQREHAGRFSGENCWRCGAKRVDQQLGLEPSPDLYVQNMVDIFRQVRRCLRPDGTLWLNLGDSYNNGQSGGHGKTGGLSKSTLSSPAPFNGTPTKKAVDPFLKPKDLVGIPWRVAFALQADGWYLRQDIIWAKPNPMPESVRDRCTRSHEYLFLLSKEPRYYFDVDAVREPMAAASVARLSQDVENQTGSTRVPGKTNGNMKAVRAKGNARTFRGGGKYTQGQSFDNSVLIARESHGNAPNETGLRNRRSVWTITTKPFKEAHFATFPPDLVEPCALAGCPTGGYILDPFAGSGTVGLVANKLNRHAILFELNPDYVEMAKRRCNLTPAESVTPRP